MKLLSESLLSALAVVAVLGLAACGKKDEGTAPASGTTDQPATGTGTTGSTTTTN
ncbi:MAG TPA: hypothetical protein VH835_16265 [Dongiaceae bacterium]|jgi:uncharacterized lipoprotein YehR (DUF1307 family)